MLRPSDSSACSEKKTPTHPTPLPGLRLGGGRAGNGVKEAHAAPPSITTPPKIKISAGVVGTSSAPEAPRDNNRSRGDVKRSGGGGVCGGGGLIPKPAHSGSASFCSQGFAKADPALSSHLPLHSILLIRLESKSHHPWLNEPGRQRPWGGSRRIFGWSPGRCHPCTWLPKSHRVGDGETTPQGVHGGVLLGAVKAVRGAFFGGTHTRFGSNPPPPPAAGVSLPVNLLPGSAGFHSDLTSEIFHPGCQMPVDEAQPSQGYQI